MDTGSDVDSSGALGASVETLFNCSSPEIVDKVVIITVGGVVELLDGTSTAG